MSNSVAPLPSGGGVTVIAEHRPHRDHDGHHQAEDDQSNADGADGGAPGTESGWDRRHNDAPPPMADDEIVPAGTLFAATLLANQMRQPPLSPDELKLQTSQGWTPPDSPLRLKDKLI